MIDSEPNAPYWQRQAKRIRRQVNFGTWLSRFVPLAAAVALLGAIGSLLARRQAIEPGARFWLLFGGSLVVAGILQWLTARRRFLDSGDALHWLDERLGLHNRLGSARDGVGSWPAPLASAPKLIHWRWSRIVAPLLFAAAILTLATSIPVSLAVDDSPGIAAEPLAWSETDAWLEELRAESLIEDETVESFERGLGELRDQPREEWYEHSSLEAGESLREQLETSLRSMANNLEQANRSVSALSVLADPKASSSAARPSIELTELTQNLSETLTRLDSGTLRLDGKLSRELQEVSGVADLRQLSRQELKELSERLERGAGLCLRRSNRASERVALASGRAPAAGGVSRGPGTAPLELTRDRTELGSKGLETITNPDLANASFGEENRGVSQGEHDVDVSGFREGQAAGAVVSRGEGGELVFRNELTPAEKRILRRFFK